MCVDSFLCNCRHSHDGMFLYTHFCTNSHMRVGNFHQSNRLNIFHCMMNHNP